jgi:hypothetical protein
MAQQAQAQPVLNFQRVINNQPTVELYMTVGCEGMQSYFTDKRFFKVEENGIRIDEFELWCPDPVVRCGVSMALVLDASSSMAGSGNAGAKAAGNAFVDMRDVTDEAAVIWCDRSVRARQGMTINAALLHSAVDSLPAGGPSAIWDGIYFGLLELINNGVNQCRAVIAMTDGRDSVSSRTVAEIISLADRNRIRVCTVGLGDSVNRSSLQTIAVQTGGRFFETPHAAQLVAIYQEISTYTTESFGCLITYQSMCMDGGMRTVDLSVVDFCGGSDTKTKTFKAIRDTSTFTAQRMVLGSALALGDTTAAVPLRSLDAIAAGTVMHPSVIALRYDTRDIRCVSLAVPPGSPLDGVPRRVVETDSGLTIETLDRKFLATSTPPGTIAEITFRTRRNPGGDTVVCPLQFASWTFSAGCIKPVPGDGEIRILPLTTGISTTLPSAAALELFPDPSAGAIALRIPSRPGEAVHISVHDLLGRTLLEREETSASDLHQSTLSLLPAPPGTYLVSISSGARRWTRTLRLY